MREMGRGGERGDRWEGEEVEETVRRGGERREKLEGMQERDG